MTMRRRDKDESSVVLGHHLIEGRNFVIPIVAHESSRASISPCSLPSFKGQPSLARLRGVSRPMQPRGGLRSWAMPQRHDEQIPRPFCTMLWFSRRRKCTLVADLGRICPAASLTLASVCAAKQSGGIWLWSETNKLGGRGEQGSRQGTPFAHPPPEFVM
jgi:hypothetical protein